MYVTELEALMFKALVLKVGCGGPSGFLDGVPGSPQLNDI